MSIWEVVETPDLLRSKLNSSWSNWQSGLFRCLEDLGLSERFTQLSKRELSDLYERNVTVETALGSYAALGSFDV